MNKTLYLRDEDAPIWDRARELAGDKLSPVIVDGLKRFVSEKEARAKGFQRIVVEYKDRNLPKAKAFFGRWIVDLENPVRREMVQGGVDYDDVISVAETAKGNVVAYWHRENGETSWDHKFLVYGSFEKAAAKEELNDAICEALRRRGVPVEELDI